MTKTNKSVLKRVKITKKGKLLTRKPGQNHFNSRTARIKQLGSKKPGTLVLDAKTKSRVLPNR
ncbi:50S ribosomal protein L35 [Candidatus Nomurabacteria bacterium]|nr:50S ribosomal protein L35 [Candidatus Nomurabacteria bacterium]MCB9820325.1 50S ribosomal protein L35 [Candidatus Nomurabacteria bacterium]